MPLTALFTAVFYYHVIDEYASLRYDTKEEFFLTWTQKAECSA